MRGWFCFLAALIIVPAISSGQAIDISPEFSGRDDISFSPDVIRNTVRNEWLVVWGVDDGAGPANLEGRIVRNNGSLGKVKTLVKGAFKIQDLLYNPSTRTYLLLYIKFQKGDKLFIQAFNESLARIGTPQLISKSISCDPIDSSVSNACYSAQLAFGESQARLLVFWLDFGPVNNKFSYFIHKRGINAQGKPVGPAEKLVVGTKLLMRLRVVRNLNNGEHLLFYMESADVNRLLYFRLTAGGALVTQKPFVVASSNKNVCCPLNEFKTTADATFSPVLGIVTWLFNAVEEPFRHKVRFRRLKTNGTKRSVQITLETSELITDDQITTYFDSQNSRFVVLWTANEIRGARFNAITGALVDPPFTVSAISQQFAQVVNASFSDQFGKALIIWIERNPGFQVRGLIL